MKALQTRSPIHLFYQDENLDKVDLSIWVSDTPEINSTSTPDYSLSSSAINGLTNFEISELVRSKNQYLYKADFYTKRDTAKYVLTKAIINKIYATKAEAQTAVNDFETRVTTDPTGAGTFEAKNCLLELLSPIIKYDFLRVRDGYVTRQEQPQIFKNLITTDISLWANKENVSIVSGITDPFGGTDAFLINDVDDANQFVISNPLEVTGEHTLRVFVKQSTGNLFSIGTKSTKRVIFNILNNTVTNNVGNLKYDITNVGDYKLLSVVVNIEVGESFRIVSETVAGNEQIFVFSPTVTKGNLLNNDASDLILQDNTTIYSDGVIIPKIGFDKKLANTTYSYVTGLAFTSQSVFRDVTSNTLTYDQLDGTITTQDIKLNELDECKFTPAKVSFVNRFGVIQDLIFFKKRVDSLSTSKEDYKANVLQGLEYYSHIGSKQNISKESERSITLNSGFYPEEFNTVFEQLQNSLYYWIDDEPAVLDGSSLEIKTRVNDKLINYTFDFSYGNNEINTI